MPSQVPHSSLVSTRSDVSDRDAPDRHEPARRAAVMAVLGAAVLFGTTGTAKELGPEATILVCLSGRGDKDMDTAGEWFGLIDGNGRA